MLHFLMGQFVTELKVFSILFSQQNYPQQLMYILGLEAFRIIHDIHVLIFLHGSRIKKLLCLDFGLDEVRSSYICRKKEHSQMKNSIYVLIIYRVNYDFLVGIHHRTSEAGEESRSHFKGQDVGNILLRSICGQCLFSNSILIIIIIIAFAAPILLLSRFDLSMFDAVILHWGLFLSSKLCCCCGSSSTVKRQNLLKIIKPCCHKQSSANQSAFQWFYLICSF